MTITTTITAEPAVLDARGLAELWSDGGEPLVYLNSGQREGLTLDEARQLADDLAAVLATADRVDRAPATVDDVEPEPYVVAWRIETRAAHTRRAALKVTAMSAYLAACALAPSPFDLFLG